MDFRQQQADLGELRRRNRFLGATVTLLAVTAILNTLLLAWSLNRERTVTVPPVLSHGFSVTSVGGSKEYLVQMATYVATLVLDVDPESIDFKRDLLANWIGPGMYGEVRLRQDVEAARLRRINAETFFRPQQFIPDEKSQAVILRGRLRTMVNGKETSTEPKTYQIDFDFSSGRALLKTFKELPNDYIPSQSALAPAESDGAVR